MQISAIIVTAFLGFLKYIAADGSRPLKSFTGLGTGIYFDGALVRSSNGSYGFSWVGPNDLGAQFVTEVRDGNLFLDMSNAINDVYNSTSAFFTVSMPAGTLGTLRAYSNQTLTAEGSIFNTTSDELLVVARGAGQTVITNVTQDFDLQSFGKADIIVNGTIGEVTYQSNGAGNLYVNGATKEIQLQLRGTGSVNINATADVQITGSAYGTAQVNYNRGTCTVSSNGPTTACVSTATPSLKSNPPALPPTLKSNATTG